MPRRQGAGPGFRVVRILVSLSNGKRALVAGQKSGVVTAVDPDRSGAILWQTRVGRGSPLGGVQWGSAADDSKIYVAVSDTKINPVAPGTLGAQTSPFNPNVAWLLDSKAGGGLHALNLGSGEEVWQTPHPGCNDVPGCGPAQSAAVTAIPGIVFSGGIDGHLRAYSANDGRIVWDVDTKREYRTVNGVAARAAPWTARCSCRRRHALCWFGIRTLGRYARKCAASLLVGRPLNRHFRIRETLRREKSAHDGRRTRRA